MTLLATVLRGLRSRGLLSAASVLLTALAIGSAVLGPIFQVAVTSSYLVSRLDEAPNPLTGLTWRFSPEPGVAAGDAEQLAASAVADVDGPFAQPRTSLETQRVPALGGLAMLQATDGACERLELAGRCPEGPGEVLVLTGDLDQTGSAVGDTLDLGVLGEVTVVGGYRVPEASEDFWFDLARFASIPRRTNDGTGVTTPYQPAPLVTDSSTFDALPVTAWEVRVDRRLEVPADLTLADLGVAQEAAASLDGPPQQVEGGRLRGESINDVAAIAAEARTQQATAGASIAPAVISLVLVALALLLRLLMAAADLRLPELALASLRGVDRRQMWALGLSEPLSLLALSVPIGGALGVGLALGLVRWWLVPGLPLPLPWTAVLAGTLVAMASLGVAVLAVWLVLRISLSDQLTGVRRPRATSRAALVAQLTLVAAAISVLVSKLSAGGAADPDATDLVLPVLLALVAGVAATRLTGAAATWMTRRRTRSLAGWVAARAVSRRQEGTLVILPVTAAIAICVFGAGVHDSAGQWRASVAATATPAAVVWSSPLPLDGTVDLTHELDPDGQWLMAASTFSTQGPLFTVLDTPRLSRVAAWQDQWTPGVGTEEITEALTLEATAPTLTGRRIGLTLDRRTPGSPGELFVRLRFDVRGSVGREAYVGPFGPGTSTVAAATPYCREGCRLEAITLAGPAAQPMLLRGVMRISEVTADSEPVVGALDGAGWTAAVGASAGEAIEGVETDGDELAVSVDSGSTPVIVQLSAGSIPAALPVVKGVDAETSARAGSTSQTSATAFDVDPVVTARSVPLLGPVGLLIDYGTVTANRTLYEQDAPVHVLARADAPESVTQGLRDRGLSVGTTLSEVQRTLDQSAYALALRLYAVVAVLVLLMALAGLVVSTAVQLPSRRRDAASLRVVGVPRRSVVSAVVGELGLVLAGTAIAGLAAGSLAQYVVLRTVTLGYVEGLTTPALVAAIDWQRLALLALVAALVLGGLALASAVLTVRGARGATLRENAR